MWRAVVTQLHSDRPSLCLRSRTLNRKNIACQLTLNALQTTGLSWKGCRWRNRQAVAWQRGKLHASLCTLWLSFLSPYGCREAMPVWSPFFSCLFWTPPGPSFSIGALMAESLCMFMPVERKVHKEVIGGGTSGGGIREGKWSWVTFLWSTSVLLDLLQPALITHTFFKNPIKLKSKCKKDAYGMISCI